MWSVIALLGLIGIVLIARLWVYAETPEVAMSSTAPSASDQPQQLQPDSFRAVQYRLGRWDMFARSANFCLRNRLVQCALLLGLAFLEWTVISNAYAESIWPLLIAAIVAPIVVFGIVAILGSLICF